MKRIYSYLICLVLVLTLVLSLVGCTEGNNAKTKDQEIVNPSHEPSGSETQNDSIDSSKLSNDIILDIEEKASVSGRGLSLNGILKSEVASGDTVQIVGIGQTPIEAQIGAIVLDGSDIAKGSKGQSVGLIFENVKPDDVKDMQRVVVAKHKKESELKLVETIDDVFGIVENGVYKNECFGFRLDFGQSNFDGEISKQEGYRVSFKSPASFYDFSIVYITSADKNASLVLYMSNLNAVTYKTASEQLAHEYQQYDAKPVQTLLGDKEVSYVQFNSESGANECYAMNVNGYYIKWYVSKKTNNYNEKIEEIMNSVRFDWVKE